MAYFGALGFTKPVEQLVLHTVPLWSLLYWLSKPKGPNLVEATIPAGLANMVLTYRVLAIEVSGRILYGKEHPLVGVGLVYRLPYLSTIPFSAAYMCLNEWHSTVSDKESEDWLEETCLLFVPISEMSGFFPVAI